MASFTGDGAYDRPTTVYTAVQERHPAADVIVPPRVDAVPSTMASTAPCQRDRHIQAIIKTGCRAWQRDSGYTIQARVENQIGRFKQIIDDRQRFHRADARATEVVIAVAALNRMLELGRSNSVRST